MPVLSLIHQISVSSVFKVFGKNPCYKKVRVITRKKCDYVKNLQKLLHGNEILYMFAESWTTNNH